MPIPIILGYGLAGLAGFIAGAVSRQPEVNELKKQVKALQVDVERLQNMITIQKHQITELQIRYTALKGWQMAEKSRMKGYIRGSLIYEYALKEYLSMLIYADQAGDIGMNDAKVNFYNAFGKILTGGTTAEGDRGVVLSYISNKYAEEINRFQEPDFDQIMNYLGSGI